MKPIIYYRENVANIYAPDHEFKIASKYFDVTNSRMDCKDRLVIGRYSVLPFYKELERDLKKIGSTLINSFEQHYFIANFNWYEHVKEFTPKTYFYLQDVPKDENKSFVVKGRTNSRKQEWRTKMFANGYMQAANIYADLSTDPLLQNQGIIVREYVPLNILGHSIMGLPYANEHRFFFYKHCPLTNFFYWTDCDKLGSIGKEGFQFVYKIADILAEHLNFFVIDVAEKENGDWILIEVNDGQMSGLNIDNADVLYERLAEEPKLVKLFDE